MPHLSLEYTGNITDPVDVRELFSEVHAALLELESFVLLDLKSRAHRLEAYHIGDGDPRRAMVHLDVSLLAGRDISVRQRVLHVCMRVLAKHFSASMRDLDCQLSVEVREIDRSTYAKQRGGSA